MKKYLIVYYSRTGTSGKAAYGLYELLGGEGGGMADIEEIKDLKNRSGVWGAIISVRDALSNNITKIEAVKYLPSDYLHTVIITPIWAGKMSDAIRTYLAAHKTDIRELTVVTCANSQTGEEVQKDVLIRFARKSNLISLKKKEVSKMSADKLFAGFIAANKEGEVGENENEM